MANDFRASQGIVPFGVGAMIDFPDDTLMMAGLDAWQAAQPNGEELLEATRVTDGRLADRLTVRMGRPITYFISPALAPEWQVFHGPIQTDRAYMPFVRFPTWHYCPRCRRMKVVPWNTVERSHQLRCDNPNRLKEGKGPTCRDLPKYRRPKLIPVRFVVACEAGHISDFPWEKWVHGGSTCPSGIAELYFTSTTLPGLSGISIQCRTCGEKSTLARAFNRKSLAEVIQEGCSGNRPWLGPTSNELCTQELQTIQRGASNAYFAEVAKSILIPPHSTKLRQVLDYPKTKSFIEALLPELHRPTLDHLAREHRVDPEDFFGAVRRRYVDGQKDQAAIDETSYRRVEYNAFAGPRPPQEERHDFDLRIMEPRTYGEWFTSHFEAVTLVPKLRETRVLTGFSRLLPPAADRSRTASLSLGKTDWLPGVSVRGEGIFLRLRRSRLDVWATRPSVERRMKMICDNADQVPESMRRFNEIPSAQLILVHTLAHLLIRQLAFESGYDASSIQERLYVAEGTDAMAGVLLYTASGDSEGTLGGLVRRGRPEYLAPTVQAALRNAEICSSDPLCIESSGQGLNSLNLAACHACSLLPETSCEKGNMFLDRGLSIGTPEDSQLAFFDMDF